MSLKKGGLESVVAAEGGTAFCEKFHVQKWCSLAINPDRRGAGRHLHVTRRVFTALVARVRALQAARLTEGAVRVI